MVGCLFLPTKDVTGFSSVDPVLPYRREVARPFGDSPMALRSFHIQCHTALP